MVMSSLLVVDDDETVRESVAAVLSAFGYGVIQAKDGLEAILLYRGMSASISLIIMDVVMPRMDGIAAARVIKEMNPFAKIILMSGYSEQPPMEVKPDGFIPKPFKSKNLRVIVEQVLQMA